MLCLILNKQLASFRKLTWTGLRQALVSQDFSYRQIMKISNELSALRSLHGYQWGEKHIYARQLVYESRRKNIITGLVPICYNPSGFFRSSYEWNWMSFIHRIQTFFPSNLSVFETHHWRVPAFLVTWPPFPSGTVCDLLFFVITIFNTVVLYFLPHILKGL